MYPMLKILRVAFACAIVFMLIPDVQAASGNGLNVTVLQRTTKSLLKADQPWESFVVNLATVIRDGGQYRMWYEAYDSNYTNDNDANLCYATSTDGVTWTKPSMGLVNYGANSNNNIIVSGASLGGLQGESIFIDPSAPAGERYKMVYSQQSGSTDWHVRGGTSADGVHWNFPAQPLLNHMSDTQNVCYYDGGKYRMYVRMWRNDGAGPGDPRRRTVGYTESSTFGNFPAPVEILKADAGDPADMDFYNSATAKLGDNQYLMFPSAFLHTPDTTSIHVAASVDGENFIRLGRDPLLPLGTGFDSKQMYACPGLIPGDVAGTYWMYYIGDDFKHGQGVPGLINYGGAVGRALIQVDGTLMAPEPVGAGLLMLTTVLFRRGQSRNRI
jgi:hypothetical protein